MRACFDRRVTVGKLIFAKLRKGCGEGRLFIFDLFDLLAVMLLNHILDGVGTGMGGLFTHLGRHNPKAVPRHIPDRCHRGWPHIAFDQ